MEGTGDRAPLALLAEGRGRALLVALLAADGGFVLLTLVQLIGRVFDGTWAIMGADGGAAEWFQYGKALTAATLLGRVAARAGRPAHGWWAAVMVYVMLDDSLRLHEQIGGNWIGETLLPVSSSLADYHGGQVVYAAIVAVLIGIGAVIAWRAGDARSRRLTRTMAAMIALLGACGAGLDYASGHFGDGFAGFLMFLAEELGEHLAITGALWFAFVDRAVE